MTLCWWWAWCCRHGQEQAAHRGEALPGSHEQRAHCARRPPGLPPVLWRGRHRQQDTEAAPVAPRAARPVRCGPAAGHAASAGPCHQRPADSSAGGCRAALAPSKSRVLLVDIMLEPSSFCWDFMFNTHQCLCESQRTSMHTNVYRCVGFHTRGGILCFGAQKQAVLAPSTACTVSPCNGLLILS